MLNSVVFSHLGGLQFWQNFVLTKLKGFYLFIYFFILLLLFLKIQKKNYCHKSPTFWGVKKKVLGTFFPHTFQFWFSVSFPTVWRVLFKIFFFKKQTFGSWYENKGNYNELSQKFHKYLFLILGDQKIQPYMCIKFQHTSY